MASSTLVKDLLYRVSVQLHDISPQFTRWTQRELISALNDGQKAIAKYMPSSCSRVDAVKLVPGTKQSIEVIPAASIKPGDGSAAAQVLGHYFQAGIRNMGTDGLTPGKAVRVADREILDVNDPLWHTKTAAAVSQYMFDPRMPKVFYVSPGVPSDTNVWLDISFLSNPIEISVTGDYGMDSSNATKISVDDKYVDDLVNYILARCWMKDAEFANNGGQASAHVQLFTASINAQVAAQTGVNPNLRALPMNPNVPSSAPVSA